MGMNNETDDLEQFKATCHRTKELKNTKSLTWDSMHRDLIRIRSVMVEITRCINYTKK
jgi:hypothetical protein